jgi:hypothetical protein
MRGNPGPRLAGACEGAVPSRLQFRRHEPVLGIGSIIRPERPIGGIAGRLKITLQGFANLITVTGGSRLELGGGCDGAWLNHLQQRVLDGIVDPQAAEDVVLEARLRRDATRFAIVEQAIVEQAAPAGVARDVMLGPGVTDRQLAPAAPAANETGEQGVAVPGHVTPKACLRHDDAGLRGHCR